MNLSILRTDLLLNKDCMSRYKMLMSNKNNICGGLKFFFIAIFTV